MKSRPEINYRAWANTMLRFIRSKGLERELVDYAGGWPCPIDLPTKGGPTENDPHRPYCKLDQSCCDFCCGN